MRSLTGFGSGTATLAGGRVQLEIRALNHKHQDVRLRMPTELGEHASLIEQSARASLGRGRYDISVRADGQVSSLPKLDEAKVRAVYRDMARLRDEIAPGSDLPLSAVLNLPDVFSTHGPDPKEAKEALLSALAQAGSSLTEMRVIEGTSLKADLKKRLTLIQDLRQEIAAGSADLVLHHKQRLAERVAKLLADAKGLAAERLEQEIAVVADRSDITEELVRLESHFSQMDTLLESDEPVGRRLDFLLQEVGREVNTIGSKSQHAKVAHLVVDMKSEVERLREQVQNVD